MTSPLILCDVDDCLLDWCVGFRDFLNTEEGFAIDTWPRQWDMTKWLHVSAEEVGRFITTFNDTHWRFGCLPPYRGAAEGVDSLVEAGCRLVAVTSCSDNPGAHNLRRANLHHVFGDVFEAVHILPLGASKRAILHNHRLYNGAAVYIEDNLCHAMDGHEVGYRVIVPRQSQNADFERADDPFTWVDDWPEILDLVTAWRLPACARDMHSPAFGEI